LTEKVLTSDLVQKNQEFFHERPSCVPDLWNRQEYLSEVVLPFLRLLKDKLTDHRNLDSSEHEDESTPVDYEDLFAICGRLGTSSDLTVDSMMVKPFVSSLPDELKAAGIPLRGELSFEAELSVITLSCKDVIRYTVWKELGKERKPRGLNAVLDLAVDPSITGLKIATLNHDSLIETLLIESGVEFDDGFGQPEDGIRYFSRDLFRNTSRISLLKLHGGWNLVEVLFQHSKYKLNKLGLQASDNPQYRPDPLGRHLEPFFLIGDELKAMDYWTDIYRDFFIVFDEWLESNDTVVVSGYGWRDWAVNTILRDWMRRHPERKLVFLHQNLQKLIDDRHDPNLNEWRREGRLIDGGKWLCNSTGKDILELVRS
jgi:hypothetical protein